MTQIIRTELDKTKYKIQRGTSFYTNAAFYKINIHFD